MMKLKSKVMLIANGYTLCLQNDLLNCARARNRKENELFRRQCYLSSSYQYTGRD